ncbi:MAG: hypothetical protein ACRD2D_14555 [Terriglobales bacterium]
MDLDRAIEFLLAEGARLDARMSADQIRFQAGMDQLKARQDQFDHQLQIMAQLGTKITRRAFAAIATLAESDRRLDTQLAQLATQVKATSAQVEKLSRQSGPHRNGGPPPKKR